MHTHDIDRWRQDHSFLGATHSTNERRIWAVVAVTTVMMVVEIAAGIAFGSMALLADGLHMATHAGALGISGAAYWLARRHRDDPRFAFSSGKFGDLAGYTSAICLFGFSLLIAWESLSRLVEPVVIAFDEAILVAVLGLAVNLWSAWVLGGGEGHGHGHGAGHAHHHEAAEDHHHHRHHDGAHAVDHNLRGAYLHVLADALTSVLAIAALLLGRFQGWAWLDPAIGILGAVVIARWAYGLMRESGAVLLDAADDPAILSRVQDAIEQDGHPGDRVADLHIWRVGPGHRALIVTLVTDRPRPPSEYKQALKARFGFSHVTVEVEPCPDHQACAPETA